MPAMTSVSSLGVIEPGSHTPSFHRDRTLIPLEEEMDSEKSLLSPPGLDVTVCVIRWPPHRTVLTTREVWGRLLVF